MTYDDLGQTDWRRDGKYGVLPRHVGHQESWFGLDHATTERHRATQSRLPEAAAERLAHSFLGRPQPQERLELTRLSGHPVEFVWCEPTVGQLAYLTRVQLLDVHADGTIRRGCDHYEVVRVAEAHREPGDVRATVGVVVQRRTADERAREVEQQVMGRGPRLGAGGCHPDMNRISHRKKVTHER